MPYMVVYCVIGIYYDYLAVFHFITNLAMFDKKMLVGLKCF